MALAGDEAQLRAEEELLNRNPDLREVIKMSLAEVPFLFHNDLLDCRSNKDLRWPPAVGESFGIPSFACTFLRFKRDDDANS